MASDAAAAAAGRGPMFMGDSAQCGVHLLVEYSTHPGHPLGELLLQTPLSGTP